MNGRMETGPSESGDGIGWQLDLEPHSGRLYPSRGEHGPDLGGNWMACRDAFQALFDDGILTSADLEDVERHFHADDETELIACFDRLAASKPSASGARLFEFRDLYLRSMCEARESGILHDL